MKPKVLHELDGHVIGVEGDVCWFTARLDVVKSGKTVGEHRFRDTRWYTDAVEAVSDLAQRVSVTEAVSLGGYVEKLRSATSELESVLAGALAKK